MLGNENGSYMLALKDANGIMEEPDQMQMQAMTTNDNRFRVDIDDYTNEQDGIIERNRGIVQTQQQSIMQSVLDQQQFIIKRGKTLESSQEFIVFKRQNITKWYDL